MAGFSFGTKKSSSWAIARNRFARATATFQARAWLATKRAGLLFEREVKLGLAKGAPGGKTLKPLSPFTVVIRGGGTPKPLLDRGQQGLLGSIKTTEDKRRLAVFVGVHRTAKNADGTTLMNVALAHEFGVDRFVIKVTPKMRKFFWAISIKSGGKIRPLRPRTRTIMHPGIPARPFMQPTLEAIRPKLGAVIGTAIGTAI